MSDNGEKGHLDRTLRSIEASIRALVDRDDPQSILRAIAEQVSSVADLKECSIFLLEDSKTATVVASSENPELDLTTIEVSNYPELNAVIETREPLIIEDVSSSPLLSNVKPLLDKKHILSVAVLPIMMGSELLGVLFLRMGRKGDILHDIPLSYFQATANAAALALNNMRLRRDVTTYERRTRVAREEADLERKYRTRYEDLFHLASDGLVIINTRGEMVDINRKFLRLTGYSFDEARSLKYLDLVVKEDKDKAHEFYREFRESPSSKRGYFQIETKDGVKKHVLVGVELLSGEENQALLSFQDITEEKKLQDELKRTKEFFENMINSSMDAILAADMRGNIIVFNQGAERITGYTAEEVIGKINIVDFYTPGGAKDVMRKLRSSEYGGVGKLETTHYNVIGKSNEIIPLNVSAAIVYENGREIATVGIFQDLRPRIAIEKALRAAQYQLIESEKQSALSALSGATAHELNQPLTSIIGYAELLQNNVGESDETVVRAVNTIAREAERMSEIIKKIGRISQYRTRDYVGRTQIIDIDQASGAAPSSYENLFFSMRDALLEFRFETTIGECVFANPAAAALFGKEDVGDLLGQSAEKLFDDNHISRKILEHATSEADALPITVPLKRSDGTEVIIEILANLMETRDASTGVEVICRDVTERIRFQQDLEEAEKRSRTLIEMAGEVGMGIIIIAVDEPDRGEVIFINSRLERIFGLKVAEMRTFPFLNIVKESDRDRFREIYERAAMDDVAVYHIETEIVRRDGSPVPIEFHATSTHYMGRRVIIGFVQDVTDWVRTREELKDLKEFNESIVNNAPIGIVTLDPEGNIIGINDREQEIMGLESKEEVVGTNLFELSTIAGTSIEAYINEGLHGNRVSIARLPYTSVAGKTMVLRVEGVPLLNEDGSVKGSLVLVDDVSEEAELERSLRRERIYHESLVERSPSPIVGLTLDGTIVLFNTAAEKVSGYKREDVLGRNAFEVFAVDQTDRHNMPGLPEDFRGDEVVEEISTTIPRRDGRMVEIAWNAVPVRDEKNNVTGVIGIGRDVTEEKRLEKETVRRRRVMGAMHRLSRASIEGMSFKKLCKILHRELKGLIDFDVLSVVTMRNGLLEFEVIDRGNTPLKSRGTYRADDSYIAELLRTGEPRLVADFEKEKHLRPDDRKVVDAGIRSAMNAPMFYHDTAMGAINLGSSKPNSFSEDDFRIFLQLVDEFAMATENITLMEQLKSSNEELARKTGYFEAMLQAERSFRVDTHEEEVVLRYARNIENLFPSPSIMVYMVDEKKSVLNPVYVRDLPSGENMAPVPIEGVYRRWLRSKKEFIYHKNVTRLKTYRPHLPGAKSILAVPIAFGNEPIGLFIIESDEPAAFATDDINLVLLMTRHMATAINNVRLYDQACFLERSQEDIIENAGALIVAIDRNGVITIFNKAFEKLTGRPKTEVLGRKALDVFSAWRQKKLAVRIWEKIRDGRELNNFVLNIPLDDRRVAKTVFNSTAIKDGRGVIVQYIFVGYDLTDREVLERQLLQTAKMATLGQMAASIAHELNNPLTAISSYAQVMREKIGDIEGWETFARQLDRILEGADRIERLIGNLMDYSRMDTEEKGLIKVNDIVEEALTFSEYDLTRGNVVIKRRMAQDLPPIWGVSSQLQQVFINILTNASYALQDQGGGTIHITTRKTTKNMVRIEISDDGPGVPSDQVNRVFEPFFTTKPRGRGTGLGLSIVKDIIIKHDGYVNLRTAPGKGARFIIDLPAYTGREN